MCYNYLLRPSIQNKFSQFIKHYSNVAKLKTVFEQPAYIRLCEAYQNEDPSLGNELLKSMIVHYDFLTNEEEKSIFNEIEPYLKRMRYQFDHWDDAIHGYRETERLQWNEDNKKVIDRVRSLVFPPSVAQLNHVHILDLDKKGYIKPHIDAVRFCGDTIAGLSLLTDSVMRLVHDKHTHLYADVLLKQRSLYVMNGSARYDYKHEILSNEHSKFDGKVVFKDRRVSVICRNEPRPEDRD
ncbi:spermatogenesis associated 11-related [Holotrichia oblita]|uniref:Spermatogenesis associated 11-related n=1 Tax=Holotrichia oblita TaxID=644536 RepID=A0ACB9SL27_HOLOL|nr:spermatogenesis associated 11-related [Holotrichia oblita]